jgi:hypothetical protein
MPFFQTQSPAPAPPPATPAEQTPAPAPSKPGKSNHNHADDFLVRGTVFNEKALSFPGVRVRIRRAGEKKFRWETYTNSRGEFAVRVPQGADYEIVVQMKGFVEQKRAVDAKTGGNYESMAFRLEPDTGGKK